MQADLSQAHEAGIEKGIWTPIQFNELSTSVVPNRKKTPANNSEASPRVYGDYSATARGSSTPVATTRRLDEKARWWIWIYKN